MGIETKICREANIEYTKYGNIAVIDRRDAEIPKCSTEAMFDRWNYLRRCITQLDKESKTVTGVVAPLGAGKTTLAHQIHGWSRGALLLEKPSSYSLMLLYQKGGLPVYGFPLQFDLGFDRQRVIRTADKLTMSVTTDRAWEEDTLFSEMFYEMGAFNANQFGSVRNFIYNHVEKNRRLDLMVSLEISNDTLVERGENRGRDIEVAGKSIIVKPKDLRGIERKRKDFLRYVKDFAPLFYEEYKERDSQVPLPKVGQEIIFAGAPREYVERLNLKYKSRLMGVLEETGYSGTILRVSADPKGGIDAREQRRGEIPIMEGIVDAKRLILQRRGYQIKERSDGEGLKITTPWKVSY